MSTINNFESYINNYDKKLQKYILKKNSKPIRLLTKDIIIDDIFQELETTKDSEGKIINTRFSNEIQEYIYNFLKNKNISFEDTGYLSLRNACYGLKYNDRLELCRNINIKFDKNIDIESRINNSNGLFSNSKIVAGSTALGVGAGAILNASNSNLIPNKISNFGQNMVEQVVDNNLPTVTESVTNVANEYVNNNVWEFVKKPVSEAINGLITDNAPTLGESAKEYANDFINDTVLKNTLPINLVAGGLMGIGVGIVGAATKGLYNIVKNTVNRVSISKKNKEFIEIDNNLYKEENLNEAKRISSLLNQETGLEIGELGNSMSY